MIGEGVQASMDDIEMPAGVGRQGSCQRHEVGAPIGKGIDELPGKIEVGVFLVQFRSPLCESVHQGAEPAPLAALDSILVQAA